jgi:hypothetical protein
MYEGSHRLCLLSWPRSWFEALDRSAGCASSAWFKWDPRHRNCNISPEILVSICQGALAFGRPRPRLGIFVDADGTACSTVKCIPVSLRLVLLRQRERSWKNHYKKNSTLYLRWNLPKKAWRDHGHQQEQRTPRIAALLHGGTPDEFALGWLHHTLGWVTA